MARCAGILMPITSLPTPYGIGTIGKEAYEQTGYQITKIQVTAYGLCPKCQEDVKQSGRSPLALYEE